MPIILEGKCSWFGGPDDKGVKPSEGLALIARGDLPKFKGIFLAKQPTGTTGLARRLDPAALYVACRWDYRRTTREYLQGVTVGVSDSRHPDKVIQCRPVDWGPNARTKRIADLSPGAMRALGIETNDAVRVAVPLPGEKTVPLEEPADRDLEPRPEAASSTLVQQTWPLQRDCPKFYPDPAHNLVAVETPWMMRYGSTLVNHIMVHRKCADSLRRVLTYVWAECNYDQAIVAALHYDRYSGSYVPRPMRGSSAPSMHSFGAAIDFDDEENQFHSQHHLFRDSDLLVKAFKAEGWVWGGDWSPGSIDAMHFQAARVHGG
jgi:hypothetical protein